MERITINGSTSYDVVIERGIIGRVGEMLRDELGGEKALIVTDSNVAALYLGAVSGSLREAGYETFSLTLAPGEETKNLDNYSFLLSVLSEREFAGTDIVVALGGGMIGDLAGFAAATFKRGTKCVQMPTSLLAAVDASVGGKTAINLPTGKNQVGVIRNPAIVVCDPDVMSTLSDSALHEGYAEIIKYGILRGYDIINALREADGDYSEVIRQSVIIKRDIVEMDEGDMSFRQYLNLGHLIGHAIEASCDYEVSHGQAVAEGLAIESRAAALAGYTAMSTHLEITALLEEWGFDLSRTYSSDELLPYLLRDKRIRGGEIRLIIPIRIGDCTMRSIDADTLPDYIRAGL